MSLQLKTIVYYCMVFYRLDILYTLLLLVSEIQTRSLCGTKALLPLSTKNCNAFCLILLVISLQGIGYFQKFQDTIINGFSNNIKSNIHPFTLFCSVSQEVGYSKELVTPRSDMRGSTVYCFILTPLNLVKEI